MPGVTRFQSRNRSRRVNAASRSRINRLNRLKRQLTKKTGQKVMVGNRYYNVHVGKNGGREFIHIGGRCKPLTLL